MFGRQYVLWHPAPLDLAAMRKASEYLIGEHDFKSFLGSRHYKKSTVRSIYEITVTETKRTEGEAVFPEYREEMGYE